MGDLHPVGKRALIFEMVPYFHHPSTPPPPPFFFLLQKYLTFVVPLSHPLTSSFPPPFFFYRLIPALYAYVCVCVCMLFHWVSVGVGGSWLCTCCSIAAFLPLSVEHSLTPTPFGVSCSSSSPGLHAHVLLGFPELLDTAPPPSDQSCPSLPLSAPL